MEQQQIFHHLRLFFRPMDLDKLPNLQSTVDSSKTLCIQMVYKEQQQMGFCIYHLKQEYQNQKNHVVIKQQYRMDCNCNLTLDMEQQLLLHLRELFFHQLGKPQDDLQQVVEPNNHLYIQKVYRDQFRMASHLYKLHQLFLYQLQHLLVYLLLILIL